MADFDVAVIGGGINGAGIARAAAYHGYRTILLEKDDFAQATSSQSTKMIHGGIRYLETGDFHLIYESLRERRTLLRIAPHLVKPIEIVFPIYQDSIRPPWMIRLATLLYDLLSGRSNIGRSRTLSREEQAALPGLTKEGLRTAIAYHDAQVFDARLCLESALSAREAGAVVRNHHLVEGISLEEGSYRIRANDLRAGKPYRCSAKAVINATGPWAPFLERATQNHATKPMVYDRGIHLVVPSLGLRQGLALMASDRRLIFVLPWRGEFTLIGTTETAFEAEDFTRIPHSEAEVTYLLDAVNSFFPRRNLGRGDVLHIYSGVRTLIAGHNTSLTRLSREAEIQLFSDAPETAWLIVYGGKLTSYRALAEQTIKKLKRRVPPPPTTPLRTTENTPLYGGAEMLEIPAQKTPAFLTPDLQAAWRERYGSNWVELVDLAIARPDLQKMVLARFQFTRADLAYMVTMELAHTLEDIVLRRTTMTYSLNDDERRRLAKELERTAKSKGNQPVYAEEGQ